MPFFQKYGHRFHMGPEKLAQASRWFNNTHIFISIGKVLGSQLINKGKLETCLALDAMGRQYLETIPKQDNFSLTYPI